MDLVSTTGRAYSRVRKQLIVALVGLMAVVGLTLSLGWGSNSVSASGHDLNIPGQICGGANFGDLPTGSGGSITSAATCEQEGGSGLSNVVKTALNLLTWITGITAVFVLLIAGIRYVVSGGSSSGVTGAKNMIIYALIGVVIALLAQVIVRFVIGNVGTAAVTTGQTTTTVTYTCTASGDAASCSPMLPPGVDACDFVAPQTNCELKLDNPDSGS